MAIGSYTGLRISDILKLRWDDILEKDLIEVIEKKTGKFRRIKMNPNLIDTIQRIFSQINIVNIDNFVFLNRFGNSTISIQYVNKKLKTIAKKYTICRNPELIKSHSLRKSFGRRVFDLDSPLQVRRPKGSQSCHSDNQKPGQIIDQVFYFMTII